MPSENELTDEQLEQLKQRLVEKRTAIESALSASTEDARPVGPDSSIGRLTRQDALQQQHMASARRDRLKLQLAQLQQAMSRLDAGQYGECVRCEEPIAYERLRAQPEAPFCLRCQRA